MFPRGRSTRTEKLAPNSKVLVRGYDSGEYRGSRLIVVGVLLDIAALLRH